MSQDKKHIQLEPETHEELKDYGKLGDTFSEAIERALEEARRYRELQRE